MLWAEIVLSSTFTWLDYTDNDRRKVLDVLEIFAERSTQDDLGLGTIRDAFADILFPGTSTIQTRAKYFLFIPWMYQDLERKKVPSAQIQARGRSVEISLIYSLLESGDTRGVIGQQAKNKLRRLPSEVYWRGLGLYGIRRFEGSQSDYHRFLDSYYRKKKHKADSEEPGAEAPDSTQRNWHPAIPPQPQGFPKQATFICEREEAEFLAERIRFSTSGSLMAFLIENGLQTDVDFPWEHPQFGEFPSVIKEQLAQGRTFSELMYGASLIYNHLLCQKADLPKLSELYAQAYFEWAGIFTPRQSEIAGWDRHAFWSTVESRGARIPPRTRDFIEQWWTVATESSPAVLFNDSRVHELLASRESYLKGPLARLQNPRALEMWGGAAGADQLTYRWDNANVIISDIRFGLTGNA